MPHSEVIKFPGGGGRIVHYSTNPKTKKCAYCDLPSSKLCDAPTTLGNTCDTPMCFRHTTRAGKNIDFCRDHSHLAGKH